MRLAEIEERQRRQRREHLSTEDDSEYETHRDSAVWLSRHDKLPSSKSYGRSDRRVTFDRVYSNSNRKYSSSKSDTQSSDGDYNNKKSYSNWNKQKSPESKSSRTHRASPAPKRSSSPVNKQQQSPQAGQQKQTDRQSSLHCHWCGRRGHQEEKCWSKLGFCVRCGDKDHKREDCPRPQMNWRGFTPICPGCGGPHLGQDCPEGN